MVHPSLRGQGYGKELITKLNSAATKFFNTDIIWGSSAEIGAMRLYRKLGTWFYQESILQNNPKISEEDNLLCFKTFLNTPNLQTWRLQNDVGFAYPLTQQRKKDLSRKGFFQF